MHISDGIIDTNICIAASAAAVAIVYATGRNTTVDEIPKMGMMGSALFVASLIHFPLAGTSIHLGLFGIAGIILGKRAFPAIFAALLFQSLIFQHGGLLALGVNSLNMGAGAFAAWLIWRTKVIPESLRAILAGFSGIIVPVILMAAEFHVSGYGRGIFFLFSIYIVAAIIESLISLSAVKFLRNVKPELLIK
jgi:cobalt/nickel transport system permease protein